MVPEKQRRADRRMVTAAKRGETEKISGDLTVVVAICKNYNATKRMCIEWNLQIIL